MLFMFKEQVRNDCGDSFVVKSEINQKLLKAVFSAKKNKLKKVCGETCGITEFYFYLDERLHVVVQHKYLLHRQRGKEIYSFCLQFKREEIAY